MTLGIYGDHQVSRSLPHTSTDINGRDVRYEFMKNLMRKVLKPVNFSIHLGDLTDKANYIDGKIFEEYYDIFASRDSLHLIGNHDRSRDENKYCSLAEALAKAIPGFVVVKNIYQFDYGKYKFVCTSYYTETEDIKDAVKKALMDANKDNEFVVVLGHWHFWNDLRNAGKKLLPFAKQISREHKNIFWVLGHEHNPGKIKDGKKIIAYYLGCMNPLRFGESQGQVMMIGNKGNANPKFYDYPTGERFLVGTYTKEVKDLPVVKDASKTYLRVNTDDLKNMDTIKKHYEGLELREFAIPYSANFDELEAAEKEAKINETKGTTEEDYIEKACVANEFETKNVLPYHLKVKELVEAEG